MGGNYFFGKGLSFPHSLSYNRNIVWESCKIILVVYLALLALAAPLGLHRALLLYPLLGIYSLLALFLLLSSFGRIRLQTPIQGALRRSKQKRRSWQSAVRDWRRQQEEEKVIWSSSEKGQDPLHFLGDDQD